MTELKPNSHKYREEQTRKKKVNKVIKGSATAKKKSELSKISNVFISEEATNVKSYIFMDVLVPAIKKAVFDIITDGIDMILYGGDGRNSKKSNHGSSYVSYNKKYDQYSRDRRTEPRTRGGYDIDNLYLENRGDAEEVLSQMDDIVAEYGVLSVADLYDLVGILPRVTDHKYGWTNVRNARVVRTRDGYKLEMPKPLPID